MPIALEIEASSSVRRRFRSFHSESFWVWASSVCEMYFSSFSFCVVRESFSSLDSARAAIRSVDIRGDGIISLAALCQVITDCGKDLDTRTILRHNADVTQRLVRQEKILYQLLENAKLSRSS